MDIKKNWSKIAIAALTFVGAILTIVIMTDGKFDFMAYSGMLAMFAFFVLAIFLTFTARKRNCL